MRLSLLMRRPAYRRLWLGELISLMGDWLSYVAVSLLALSSGGGAFALAVTFAAHMLPGALVSPFAGWLADRFDRRSLLVGSQLAQALLSVAMLLAAFFGELWWLQIALFARNALAGLVHPVQQAALPKLVGSNEVVDANALGAATWSVSFTLGTALGGVLALAGPLWALAIDALSFVVAAALWAGLPALPAQRSAAPIRVESAMADALRHALERPGLFEAVFAKTPLALAGGAGWLLLNLTAGQLGGAAGAGLALGMLQAVRGAGTGLGPIAARSVAERASARTLLRASVAIALVALALFALANGWTALLVLAGLWGVGGGGSWVFSASEIQRLSDDAFVGRTSALDQLGFTLAMTGGVLLAALAVDGGLSAHGIVLAAVAVSGALYVAMLGVQPPQPRRHASVSEAR